MRTRQARKLVILIVSMALALAAVLAQPFRVAADGIERSTSFSVEGATTSPTRRGTIPKPATSWQAVALRRSATV